jgi:hypothetical protein
MNKLSDSQTQTLVKIAVWWKDELMMRGKKPEEDKRLDWMTKILTKKKYTDNAKEFLNQMRDLYLGKPKPQKQTKQISSVQQYRSQVNSGSHLVG